MVSVVRYITLFALGIASVFAFNCAIYATASGIFNTNAAALEDNPMVGMVLGAFLMVLIYFLVWRVAREYLADVMIEWYERNKENIMTVGLAGVICFAFLVL